MKKTLVAFAALAAVGAASAQATISGTIAAGYLKAIDGGKGFVLDSNSIKFAVSEDLGGGLKLSASTQLAGNSNRGGGATKEDSSIALAGSFGTLSYANTRSSSFAQSYGLVGDNWLWDGSNSSSGTKVAVITKVAAGTTPAVTADVNVPGVFSRVAIDAVGYSSPSMGGASFGLGYSESSGDGAGTPKTTTTSVALRYAAGPLSAGVRALKSSNPALIRTSSFELGANYDLGVAKIGVGYDSKRRGTGALALAGAAGADLSKDKAAMVVGVSVPMGPVSLGLNYGKRDTAKFTELGINYAMSKRTSVYANYGRSTTPAVAAAGTAGAVGYTEGAASKSVNQYNLVLVHNF